jgi:hypothetical protein
LRGFESEQGQAISGEVLPRRRVPYCERAARSDLQHGVMEEMSRVEAPTALIVLPARWIALAASVALAILIGSAMSAEAGLPTYRRVAAGLVSPAQAKALERELQTEPAATASILSATQASVEIQELARGLKHDVDLIYEYVYNRVEYTPIFGSVKGATATLRDRRGNDFDQASLMIALLRESNYSARYEYGVIRVYSPQLISWLGIENNPDALSYLLGSAGIPAQIFVNPDNTIAFVDLNHVWVEVTIDAADYVFDPSLKLHSVKPQIDLATAMGYDQTAFLSSALAGSTSASDYIQNLNKTNLAGSLTTYASNLIDYIEANHPAGKLDDIVGGWSVVPVAGPLRQAAHPNQVQVPAEWTDIPDQHRATLRVQYRGIDQTFHSDSIASERLSLFANGFNQPVLSLAGSALATGLATTPGSIQDLTLTVDHPYVANGGTYADDSQVLQIKAGGS